ncbi:hypothetical protein [Candidatus Synechococcus spongiarum]|uniref:Uncharacterized protein n=1 Tax=Candidatus Synechococcus spongiarum TaxID=431041 RepID=A0A171DF71_9SYNE|nr:hypothetical protein [Candidatus Synechococcus spongiarum]SAY38439.1 hypothetical protein FLM9_322 [Candidatus Synechococcus spongiarum]
MDSKIGALETVLNGRINALSAGIDGLEATLNAKPDGLCSIDAVVIFGTCCGKLW